MMGASAACFARHFKYHARRGKKALRASQDFRFFVGDALSTTMNASGMSVCFDKQVITR